MGSPFQTGLSQNTKPEWQTLPFQTGLSQHESRMANCIDTGETAHYEPPHQDLHCLQKQCFGLQGRKC